MSSGDACSIPSCDDPVRSLGMCRKHYLRQYRHGDPLHEPPTLAQRWLAKVDMDGPLPEDDPSLGPCWVWMAPLTCYGYGQFGGKSAYAWGYEFIVGPIPDGLQLDHICHHPDRCEGGRSCPHRACVNPYHLRPVTARENVLRSRSLSAVNATKTHCIRGHEFTPENTYVGSRGQRECRTCKKMHQRRQTEKDRHVVLEPDDPRHGTTNGYGRYGCRCDECMEAGRRSYQRWKARQANVTP